MWALLPLKNFADAKLRLSGVLAPEERRGLFLAMVKDVLSVLQSHADIDNILVISEDVSARQLADQYTAELLTESDLNVHGLNASVQAGMAVLQGRGIEEVMVIHGDLPLISAAEITHLVGVHREQAANHPSNAAVTIAPDQRREGTNCLVCSPASDMVFYYGANSFRLHTLKANQLGLPFQMVCLSGVATDIDTPKDLLALCEQATITRATHSYRYLQAQGLIHRLIPRSAPTPALAMMLEQQVEWAS